MPGGGGGGAFRGRGGGAYGIYCGGRGGAGGRGIDGRSGNPCTRGSVEGPAKLDLTGFSADELGTELA